MDEREKAALDRHITGNYGEDQLGKEDFSDMDDEWALVLEYITRNMSPYFKPGEIMEELQKLLDARLTEGEKAHGRSQDD